MPKLYAVTQDAQVQAWCWGSCGKGSIGSIRLGSKEAIMCFAESCPHLAGEDMGPVGTVEHQSLDGEHEVWIRELEEVK